MVSHDANTRRTTGEDHTIKDTPSSELRKLDAGSFKNEKYLGEKIPFLEELIGTIPSGKELVIEIKCGPEILPELKRIINDSGRDKKFVFIAFDFNTISLTKKAFPGNSCYWLCSNPELLQKNIGLAVKENLDGLSLSYNIITDSVAKQSTELGLELFTWTVDDPTEAKRLMALGVKGITTNRPGWLETQIFE
jgi:glycerophosphoryl diester phosphodiesterase